MPQTAKVVGRLVVQGHHEGLGHIQVSDRDDLVVTGSENERLIRIWDLPSRRELRTLTVPSDSGQLVAMGPQPRRSDARLRFRQRSGLPLV